MEVRAARNFERLQKQMVIGSFRSTKAALRCRFRRLAPGCFRSASPGAKGRSHPDSGSPVAERIRRDLRLPSTLPFFDRPALRSRTCGSARGESTAGPLPRGHARRLSRARSLCPDGPTAPRPCRSHHIATFPVPEGHAVCAVPRSIRSRDWRPRARSPG